MLLRIQIISSGVFLVLSENGVLTIENNSPLFNSQDIILGSYSYPGKAPLEPNRAAIQNAHLITTDSKLRSFDVQVWLGYLPWTIARFNFTIENSTIVYNLLIDNGLVANQLKTLKLNDLFGDGQVNFANRTAFYAYLKASTTAAAGTVPCVFFPYKNDGAYKVIDPASYSTYPDIALPLGPYINAWVIDGSGNGKFAEDATGVPQARTYTPAFYLTYILKQISLFLGYEPTGKWLTDTEANKITVYSSIPIGAGTSLAYFSFYMPNIGVADFLKEVRTRFGLLIVFDELSKTCTIESLTNLEASQEIIDLRAVQLKPYRETSTTLQAFKISQGFDDRDAAFTDQEKEAPVTLAIGDQSGVVAITPIDMIGVYTKMLTEISPVEAAHSNWKVPYIKQPIYGATPFEQVSSISYADRRSFNLRFLYYHGLTPNASGNLYPYASVDNTDVGNNILTTFTLALNASGSTILSVKQFYEFRKNSKPFEMTFLLTTQQFLSLRAKTKIAVSDFNRATVHCLVDKVSADLGAQSTIIAKASLYPIIMANNTAPVIPVFTPPPPDPPYDNGLVYVRLILTNYDVVEKSYPPPFYNRTSADVVLKFYADAAGTIPKEVVRLSVGVHTIAGSGPTVTSNYISYYNCTTVGAQRVVQLHAPVHTNAGGVPYNWEYKVEPDTRYRIIP